MPSQRQTQHPIADTTTRKSSPNATSLLLPGPRSRPPTLHLEPGTVNASPAFDSLRSRGKMIGSNDFSVGGHVGCKYISGGRTIAIHGCCAHGSETMAGFTVLAKFKISRHKRLLRTHRHYESFLWKSVAVTRRGGSLSDIRASF